MRRAAILAAPLAVMALIFALSSLPGKRVPVPRRWDKVAHAAEYAVLGWFARRALRELGVSPGWATVLAAAGGAAYGVTDELHQSFVPNRSVEVADGLADAMGAALGSAAQAGRERLSAPSREAPGG